MALSNTELLKINISEVEGFSVYAIKNLGTCTESQTSFCFYSGIDVYLAC